MREALATVALCAAAAPAFGAEGASSHYLPRAVGDMLFALPREPGLTFANTVWYQSGNVSRAVLEGQFEFGLGPGFFSAPAFADGKLSILGEWMHDVHAKNRFESDYVSLIVA